MIGANFHHYSVAYGLMIVRLHTFIIGFRLTTPLSQAPLLGQDELTRRKRDLDTRGLSVRLPHLALIMFQLSFPELRHIFQIACRNLFDDRVPF